MHTIKLRVNRPRTLKKPLSFLDSSMDYGFFGDPGEVPERMPSAVPRCLFWSFATITAKPLSRTWFRPRVSSTSILSMHFARISSFWATRPRS